MQAGAPETSGVQAIIGISGLSGESGGFRLAQEHVVRFELPADFHAGHCETFQRDLKLLTQIASDHSNDFAEFQNAAVRNDFHEASRIAERIGLTEERFQADGGGFWIYIAAAAVVIGAYAAFGGSSSDTPPPPPPPPPDTTIVDAGVDG
jgi:hypothetical protein